MAANKLFFCQCRTSVRFFEQSADFRARKTSRILLEIAYCGNREARETVKEDAGREKESEI